VQGETKNNAARALCDSRNALFSLSLIITRLVAVHFAFLSLRENAGVPSVLHFFRTVVFSRSKSNDCDELQIERASSSRTQQN